MSKSGLKTFWNDTSFKVVQFVNTQKKGCFNRNNVFDSFTNNLFINVFTNDVVKRVLHIIR